MSFTMSTPNTGRLSRILCVGLRDDLCTQLRIKLEDLSYLIISVSTFAAALQKIDSEPFDHYIFAENLPDGTCLNLCKLIRQTDPHTPIIFYSEKHSPVIVKKALQVGANAYFNKLDDLKF
jgi:DNA-binding response OmpR family regulator